MEKTNEPNFQTVKQLRMDLNALFTEIEEKLKILTLELKEIDDPKDKSGKKKI